MTESFALGLAGLFLKLIDLSLVILDLLLDLRLLPFLFPSFIFQLLLSFLLLFLQHEHFLYLFVHNLLDLFSHGLVVSPELPDLLALLLVPLVPLRSLLPGLLPALFPISLHLVSLPIS